MDLEPDLDFMSPLSRSPLSNRNLNMGFNSMKVVQTFFSSSSLGFSKNSPAADESTTLGLDALVLFSLTLGVACGRGLQPRT
jgi:hypothetical protein